MLSEIKEPQLGYDPELLYQRVAAEPFLKWAGGKRNLLSTLTLHFPSMREVNRYFEPFLGGGAVFFHLQHPNSLLSDSNEELIEVYQVVREQVEDLILVLKQHHNEHEYYYKVRSQKPALLSRVERAARFIFLNRTCYNGLYRVNSRGQFNVPFGRYKNPLICDTEGLRASSLALRNAHIFVADFEAAVSDAGKDDFVYFDPPYYPLSETSSFTSYTVQRFAAGEQERLAQVFQALTCRGCRVLLSNSDTPLIRKLYESFATIEVQANRAISCKADGRGEINELLIKNY